MFLASRHSAGSAFSLGRIARSIIHRSFFSPGDPIPSSSSLFSESRSDGDQGKCDSGVQTIADDEEFQTWGPSLVFLGRVVD